MHPILARRERLFPYLLGWLPVAALVAGMLTRRSGWLEALLLVVPLLTVYAFGCLAAWYPCRALPLLTTAIARTVATHIVSAVISAGLWVILAWLLARLVGRATAFAGAGDRILDQAGTLFAIAALLYLLSVALHYILAAFEESRRAERRALEAELAQREAELRAFKAQFNPHFLFNSLNSIASLVTGDPATARQVCVQLGELLRSVLTASGSGSHPLAEELALVRRYLAIEQVRFGSRLEVVEEIAPECLDCSVPPLVLQPLVENALKHGIAHLLAGGVVRITARSAGRRLQVAVANPTDPDAPRQHRPGFGLALVRQRLQAEHGAEAGLRTATTGNSFSAEPYVPFGANPTGSAA